MQTSKPKEFNVMMTGNELKDKKRISSRVMPFPSFSYLFPDDATMVVIVVPKILRLMFKSFVMFRLNG